jgi:polyisoprenyl-phosphate glycosyltransferase
MVLDTRPPTVTIIVPVFNEEGNIRCFLDAVRAQAAVIPERLEFLFIDDGSQDGTWACLESAAAEDPAIRCIRLSRNFGKENALAAGLDDATGDAVIVMDGDLQHPPEIIPEMLEKWRGGHADIVDALKRERGQEKSAYRWFSKLFYILVKHLSGLQLDNASDFKLLDARVVVEWRRFTETHLFFRAMASWLGFRRVNVYFDVRDRNNGHTRWSFWRLVKLALTGITSFSSLPLHLITLSGGAFLIGALLLGGRAIVIRLGGQVPDGITLIILLNLVIGGMIMISLGIIGEYIARIFDEVKRRPRYIAAQTRGFSDKCVDVSSQEPSRGNSS